MTQKTIEELRNEYHEQQIQQQSRVRGLLNGWLEGAADLSQYIDVEVRESGAVRISTKDGSHVWWISEWTSPSKYLPQLFPGRWRIGRQEESVGGAGVVINDGRIMTLADLRRVIVSQLVKISSS